MRQLSTRVVEGAKEGARLVGSGSWDPHGTTLLAPDLRQREMGGWVWIAHSYTYTSWGPVAADRPDAGRLFWAPLQHAFGGRDRLGILAVAPIMPRATIPLA
jgi:hypothetical protein